MRRSPMTIENVDVRAVIMWKESSVVPLYTKDVKQGLQPANFCRLGYFKRGADGRPRRALGVLEALLPGQALGTASNRDSFQWQKIDSK